MYKLIGQNSVKRLADGACIPFADGNRDYEDYKLWLEKGNEPEPEFTDEEIAQQELSKKVQEAKAYLNSTDYKMTADYDKDVTDVRIKRAEARAIIRSLEVTNGSN